VKKNPSLSLIVVLHLEDILVRKDLNTNGWKNNSNHRTIFDDHNDEQVEEDKEDKHYSLRITAVIFSTYYSGRRHHLSHVVVQVVLCHAIS